MNVHEARESVQQSLKDCDDKVVEQVLCEAAECNSDTFKAIDHYDADIISRSDYELLRFSWAMLSEAQQRAVLDLAREEVITSARAEWAEMNHEERDDEAQP